MEDLMAYAIRVIIIYFFTYLGTRVLSKKAIAEMSAYEISGIILLSTVASETLATKVAAKAIFGIGLISFMIYLISRLSLVNKLTPIFEHTPTVVLRNGQLDVKALKTADLSLNQFLGLLRDKGFDKVSDVEFAIMEPQGKLSVFPRSQNRPLVPKDLNIPTQYEGLTLPLIMDEVIIERNLEHAHLDKNWLDQELKKQGIASTTDIFLAELDTSGNLIITKK